MSEPARNRFALDLEDLERQLRGAGQAPKVGQPADPLAELTRIVGQDDPLKDIFASRGHAPAASQPVHSQPVQAWPVARQEPAYNRQEPAYDRQEPAFPNVPPRQPVPVSASAPPAELRGALDEFEALLRRTDGPRAEAAANVPASAEAYVPPAEQDFGDQDFGQPAQQAYSRPASIQGVTAAPRDLDQDAGGYGAPAYAPYGYDQHGQPEGAQMADEDMPDLEPRRSRKGLWTAAALIAVGLIGVGGVMTFRGPTVTKDGQPPMISADRGPTKVEPVNPGGAEIPNQNKQIYERVGGDSAAGQTKVVSREEQPVDVQQAARSMPARVVLPGPGSAVTPADTSASNPLAQAPAAPARIATPSETALTPVPPVPGLGEPRRVRTVSIRPDGSPSAAPGAAIAAYENGGQPLATGSTQVRPSMVGTGNPSTAISGAQPRPRPAATPDQPKVQERVATPPAATTPSAPPRVASAAPAPAAAAPAPATAAIRSGTGDFSVQLAAPGSESEARATFAALQRKYPGQLGGQSPIVRKTDLAGGKTVYRLRVGPYSRDDATTMCTQLQAAGGQCFIAKN
ncbi:SPOR domain-containing protein [Bosea lathyri]|uniref:Cell division protein FtsN n=1 Tax=Bosea lathyri TaxID=1036778 RepID=A0A1H6D419_9HYPH|nr:SPOR domain-containing protein [Bosea lathyri]SEG80001.1 Cell division protein FtsN [Bosea lathyri]